MWINKINSHNSEISQEFERMQERLREHFKRFALKVRDKFEREVIQNGINQEFEKLSPIKPRDFNYEDRVEAGEDSPLDNVNESEERIVNDDCLSPPLKEKKNNLVRAYTSPLREYQSAINTTADFRKINNIEKDLEFMDVAQRTK